LLEFPLRDNTVPGVKRAPSEYPTAGCRSEGRLKTKRDRAETGQEAVDRYHEILNMLKGTEPEHQPDWDEVASDGWI
jgi:hypothetical protein